MDLKNLNRVYLRTGLIDGHVHLSEIENPERAVQKAVNAGVKRMVAVAMNIDSCRKTLALADRFPGTILPAIGYHPWFIKPEAVEDTLIFITRNIRRCVALGEVGLDYKVKVKKKLQNWKGF